MNWIARFWYPHVANAAVFIVAGSGFLLISNIDGLEPPDKLPVDVATDTGITVLFLAAAAAIAAFVHYIYLRKYRNLFKVELVAQALVQKFLRLKDSQATSSGKDRQLGDAERELAALKTEYEKVLSAKGNEALHESVDRMMGQMAEKVSDEGEFRFDEVEKTSLMGELERLRAEKAAAETALRETLEKLERKREKMQQMKTDSAPDSGARQATAEQLRREMEAQKEVYLQLVARMEEELKRAEGSNEELRAEKARKEGIIDGLKRENDELRKRLERMEGESGSLRNRLRDMDRCSGDLTALRSKLDLEQKRSSLLQEECSQLQSMLTDLGQSKSEQMDSLRKAYEENQRKESQELRDLLREREGTLKAEVERLKTELKATQEGLSKSNSELTKSASVSAEADRLKKQLEDLAARLVHAETESRQAQQDASVLRRKLQGAEDELQSNLEKVRSLQDLNAKLLEDVQSRHQAEKERLRRFYEDSLTKELESNKSFYEQKIGKLTSQLVGEREERSRLEAEVSGKRLSDEAKADAEAVKDAYLKSFQEEIEDLKRMYESSAASLRAERDKLREESEEKSRRHSELMREKGKLQKEAELANSEVRAEQEARGKTDRLVGELRAKYEDAMKQLEETKNRLTNYKESADNAQLVAKLERQIEDLTRRNEAITAELEVVREENSEFRQEVRQKEVEIVGMREESMQVHKELFEKKEFRTDSRSSEQSVKESMVIEGMISHRGENPILEKIKQMKREAPMSYSNVWKLFESLLQEKVRLDRLEMSMGRQPRTMTEFMLDFMYLHYGLKSLALKQLKALVLSLQELYRSSHIYGVTFCRFLGLFHPRPLPHHLAIYLLLVHEEFDRLSAKVKIKRTETYAEQYDLLQYGGQASIIDAMELVIKICKKNRQAGERIIAQLLPEQEDTRIDLILLKVCGTMARLGRDPSYIFELLDREHSGSIEYRDFVDGVRFNLGIWISQEEAEDLCLYINDQGTGDITYEDWSRKVNFKEYSEKVNSKSAMVTKAALLSALVEEYEYEVVQDYYTLRHMIRQSALDSASASEVLWQIDPSLDEESVDKLFEEAVDYESEFQGYVSPEAVCIVALRSRVGGFGVGIFGKSHADVAMLDQSLPKPATEGAISDLIVESRGGGLQVDIMRRPTP